MTPPTKERLATALRNAGAPDLADRALAGEFSDFETPHATPKVVLVRILNDRGMRRFATRVVMGEFDDTKAEADTWWEREGRRLIGGTD